MSASANLLLARNALFSRPGRLIAASMALGFASSLLLVALSMKAEARKNAQRMPTDLLTKSQVHLAATDPVQPFLPADVISAIEQDERVAAVAKAVRVPAFDLPATEQGDLDRDAFYDGPLAGWIPGKRFDMVAWQDGVPRGTLLEGQWPSPDAVNPIEVVVPQHLRWAMKVGDHRRLESDAGAFHAKVVGFLKLDDSFVGTNESLRLNPWQISPEAAQLIAGGQSPLSDLSIELKDPERLVSFVEQWRERLNAYPSRLELWDQSLIRSRALQGSTINVLGSAVTTALLLAGACVICIAFGVQGAWTRGRLNQYTTLRCLGASRTTLVCGVVIESICLALIGLVTAVGLPWMVKAALPFLPFPGAFDTQSIAITGFVLLFGVLIGAAWPAYVASHVQPLSRVKLWSDPIDVKRDSAWRMITLVVTIAFAGCLIALSPSGTPARALVLTWCIVPALVIVSLLSAPLVIRFVTAVLTEPIGWLTRTNPLVLHDQASGDRARGAGGVLAISVGLSGFIWIICWGASMLDSFVIDTGMPRWMVSIYPYGLDQDETEGVLAQPAFAEMEPLVLIDTRLAYSDDKTKTVPMLVMGATPAYMKDHLPIEFEQGNPDTAFEQLASGNHCLISSWYASTNGVNIGDSLSVAVPGQNRDHDYEVIGVVQIKGWLMGTKQNKTRLHSQPHQALILTGIDRVRDEFASSYANFFLGDSESTSPYPFGQSLRQGTSVSRSDRELMSGVVQDVVDLNRAIEYRPFGDTVTASERSVQTDDLDRVRAALLGEWGGAAVQRLGWMPLMFLGISLFSVTGSLVESLRSRGREIGILRSCGLSRFGLLRLVFAESLLQGCSAIIVACILGFGGAWLMLQVAEIVGVYWRWAGIHAEFLIPWSWLWPGWIMTLMVCTAASLLACWKFGRLSPARMYNINEQVQ